MLIVVYPITGKLRYLWFLADTSKLNVNLFHTSLIFLNQTLLSRTQYKDAMFPWKPLGDGINSYLQCSIYLFFASSLASYNNTSHLQSMPSIQTSPVPKFSFCVREWRDKHGHTSWQNMHAELALEMSYVDKLFASHYLHDSHLWSVVYTMGNNVNEKQEV